MTIPISPHGNSWNGRHLKIAAVNEEERKRIVGQKVAARANELSEIRGLRRGQSDQDWLLALAEIVAPLSCGYLLLDRGIELRADAGTFGEGTIEVCAEPKRLTFLGRSRSAEADRGPGETGTKPGAHWIVRSIDLPFEIEPSEVSGRFSGRMIVIYLPRARRKLAASLKLLGATG